MNLQFDAWIPTTRSLQSLTLVLENAGSLQLTSRGTQFASILRLLLAICYQSGETSQTLLPKGISSKTLKHIEQHRNSFNLHDGFLTCPELDADLSTFAKLDPFLPSGNTIVFYGHARDDHFPTLSNSELARYVLDFHAFAAAGGNSVTGYRGLSPCVDVVLGMAIGETLLETLALNLVSDSRPQNASWTLPRATQQDFRENRRQTAGSFAEQYSWLGQAVRLYEHGVGTAKGFKLRFNSDPMTGNKIDRNGQPIGLVRPESFEPVLLASRLMGLQSIGAATFSHAQSLGIPFQWRVISQVSSPTHKVKVLETIDSVYSPQNLDLKTLARVFAIRGELVKHQSEFVARAFVSTFEDQLRLDKTVELETFVEQYPFQADGKLLGILRRLSHKR